VNGDPANGGKRGRFRLRAWGSLLPPALRPGSASPAAWYADLAVGAGLLGLFYVATKVAVGGPAGPPATALRIDLAPSALPYYAVLSLLRMAAAYVLALTFALVYGYLAAYNRVAEKVLVPILDILQSVPVLSFLPTFVLALIALFPHGRAGVELAAILLIFTAQAWNLAFSFYHSLITIPADLREVAVLNHLSPWQRFRQLELPFAAVGLVWNSMMSWAGGWFFLMESEMFTLGAKDFRLPGIGSYLQQAANRGDVRAELLGLGAMMLVILLMDQLVWRPVIAWSERFKMELVEGATPPRSAVLMLLKRSRLVDWMQTRALAPTVEALDRRLARPAPEAAGPGRTGASSVHTRDVVLVVVLALAGAYAAWRGAALLLTLSPAEAWRLPTAALASLLRVGVALLLGAAWTVPVGVAIGLNRHLAGRVQPVAQMLASFPATALFPVLVVALARTPAGLNVGAVILMLLGTQWYILFNVIAGAMSLPEDLQEAARLMRLRGLQLWRQLILPGIFPYLITGLITAAGGAWNATIVAEYVSFDGRTVSTTGLGALISIATARADYALLLASTLALSALVVVVNRLVWRRLYALAEERYSLG
jgi:NitT/TauT family transport system permease protein